MLSHGKQPTDVPFEVVLTVNFPKIYHFLSVIYLVGYEKRGKKDEKDIIRQRHTNIFLENQGGEQQSEVSYNYIRYCEFKVAL